jgi:predicted membrane-bound spermidine synthase
MPILDTPITPPPNQSNKVFSLAAICFLFSGATALIYEVLWARMLGLVFGATTLAISAVLAAFMGGLATGSAAGGGLARRLRNPLRAYALIEIGIGLYALIVPWLFRVIDWVYAFIWERFHPGFYGFALSRFALAAIVLFVPTTLMGATLPVLVAAIRGSRESQASGVARLYALNLVGAIAGTVTAGFLFLPGFGVRITIWIAAAGNLLIGVAVLVIGRQTPLAPRTASVSEKVKGSSGAAFLVLMCFCFGPGHDQHASRLVATAIDDHRIEHLCFYHRARTLSDGDWRWGHGSSHSDRVTTRPRCDVQSCACNC